MLAQTIIVIVVIAALTVVMFFMLVGLVRQVNKRSKEYFEKKIVVYDDLLEEKQKHLEQVESRIGSLKNQKQEVASDEGGGQNSGGVVIMNEKLPEYKIDDFLKQVKLIDEKFKIDKEDTVKDFVQKQVHEESFRAQSLKRLYDKINERDRYEYITKSLGDDWSYAVQFMDKDVLGVMRPYISGNPKADMSEILSYIELEIRKADTEIVVETGDKADNFGHIYDKIKTVYNPDIYMGVRIFYHDHMYDYSLRSGV